jgi:hypothetical protein
MMSPLPDMMQHWFRDRIDLISEELEDTIKVNAIDFSPPELSLYINNHQLSRFRQQSTDNVTSSSKLKGFVTVVNSKITKGELTIKSTQYNRGHALKIQIDPLHPIELGQVYCSFTRSKWFIIVCQWLRHLLLALTVL